MKKGFRIITLIFNVIMLVVAYMVISQLWKVYKLNDFDEFSKAEYIQGVSEFTRDESNKYFINRITNICPS